MSNFESEGSLAARLRHGDLPVPTQVWERATSSARNVATPVPRRPRTKLLIAAAVAAVLVLAGGGALAVTYVTRPAEVHGKAITGQRGGSFAAHMGYPGHEAQMSLGQAERLAGFKVLTLQSVPGAALRSVTYVPKVVPASQPAPYGGGSVSLLYTFDGQPLQINEGMDTNPSAPLSINVKVVPGQPVPACISVQTIDGGQYIVDSCPSGKTIFNVQWKTLDGVDVSVVSNFEHVGGKGYPPVGLTMDQVQTIIEHME